MSEYVRSEDPFVPWEAMMYDLMASSNDWYDQEGAIGAAKKDHEKAVALLKEVYRMNAALREKLAQVEKEREIYKEKLKFYSPERVDAQYQQLLRTNMKLVDERADRDAALAQFRSLIERYLKKTSVFMNQTGGVYGGGENLQWINNDAQKALSFPHGREYAERIERLEAWGLVMNERAEKAEAEVERLRVELEETRKSMNVYADLKDKGYERSSAFEFRLREALECLRRVCKHLPQDGCAPCDAARRLMGDGA